MIECEKVERKEWNTKKDCELDFIFAGISYCKFVLSEDFKEAKESFTLFNCIAKQYVMCEGFSVDDMLFNLRKIEDIIDGFCATVLEMSELERLHSMSAFEISRLVNTCVEQIMLAVE